MKYTLPDGRPVYLTQRPDRVKDNSVHEFIAEKSPFIRFCFCDDYVEPPPHGPEWHWFPWAIKRGLPIENLFAFLSIMTHKLDRQFLSSPVWLHCDSSTARAPTFFGCFLRATYGDEVAKDIVSKVEFMPERYDPDYPRAEDGSFLFENPFTYSETAYRLDPGVKSLVESWRTGGEQLAREFYMSFKEQS